MHLTASHRRGIWKQTIVKLKPDNGQKRRRCGTAAVALLAGLLLPWTAGSNLGSAARNESLLPVTPSIPVHLVLEVSSAASGYVLMAMKDPDEELADMLENLEDDLEDEMDELAEDLADELEDELDEDNFGSGGGEDDEDFDEDNSGSDND